MVELMRYAIARESEIPGFLEKPVSKPLISSLLVPQLGGF
jgi:hypothetical protein